jgi:hypothetical protein
MAMSPLNTKPTTCAGARPHVDHRIGRIGALLGLATAVVVLTGCGPSSSDTPTANEPTVRPAELSDAGGRPCPKELPIGDDPSGHGFGIEEAANESPALLEPDGAWVCEYNTFEVGRTTNGGAIYGWRRTGQPEPLATAELPDLKAALDHLEPADRTGGCTDDLGPRWMVVYSHDGDLTGVVVDDYGCRDVRLTDNPHTTPPGADDQEGTVGGVLDGGAAILRAPGVGSSS